MIAKTEIRMRGVWFASLAACAVAVVASCGGGGVVGSGGTGRAASVTVGTVNGFGSVIVDGLVYDDVSAPVVRETAPGVDAIAAVRLGHRVSVEYEVAGVASLVRVEAAIAGRVASVTAPGRFSVLGQTVIANANGAVGPITQFGGGYVQASDVQAGDPIEIHGVLVLQNSVYSLQATRIDKLAAAPAYLRVTGLASNVGKAGGTLNLGALSVDTSASTVLPLGSVLVDGQTLTILALPASLTTAGNGVLRLKALQTRIRQLGVGDADSYVSGSVSQLDTSGKTFALGSLFVRYSSASLSPAGAVLTNGLYVLVHGLSAADGSLNASALTLRDTGSDGEGELKGNLSGYVSVTKRFSVRGVVVDASAASIQGCPATGFADGLFVEVHGGLVSAGLMAKTVQCESESSGATVERSGVATAVDTSAKTLTLVTQTGGPVSVKWTDTTFFGDVMAQTLAGKTIHVEGQLNGSVLSAGKIELDN